MSNATGALRRSAKKAVAASGRAMGDAGKRAENAILQKLEASDGAALRNEGKRVVPLEVEKAAIVSTARGATPAMIEREFGLNREYVKYALARRFGSTEAGLAALQGLMLENAIACNVHAAENIEEMTAPQAIMAGAILTDKVLAIEKNRMEKPKTVDFAQFASLGETLAKLGEILGSESVGLTTAGSGEG